VFTRFSRLRTAKWADIDLEANEWRYLDELKAGAKVLPFKQA